MSHLLALAGNQNCGKTTLFNALTGSNQHVGNFPGVTVEKKEGSTKSIRMQFWWTCPASIPSRRTPPRGGHPRFSGQRPPRCHHQHRRCHQPGTQPVSDPSADGAEHPDDPCAEHDGRGTRQRQHYPRQKAVAGAGHPGHSNLCCQRRGHLGPAGHRNQNSQG